MGDFMTRLACDAAFMKKNVHFCAVYYANKDYKVNQSRGFR